MITIHTNTKATQKNSHTDKPEFKLAVCILMETSVFVLPVISSTQLL